MVRPMRAVRVQVQLLFQGPERTSPAGCHGRGMVSVVSSHGNQSCQVPHALLWRDDDSSSRRQGRSLPTKFYVKPNYLSMDVGVWKATLLRFLPTDLKKLLYMYLLNSPEYTWARMSREEYAREEEMSHFDFYDTEMSEEEVMRLHLYRGCLKRPGRPFVSLYIEGHFGIASRRVTSSKVACSYYVPLHLHRRMYRREKLVYEQSWVGDMRKLKMKHIQHNDINSRSDPYTTTL